MYMYLIFVVVCIVSIVEYISIREKRIVIKINSIVVIDIKERDSI